jgi:hypothetical protein
MKIPLFDFAPSRALMYGIVIGLVLGTFFRTLVLQS